VILAALALMQPAAVPGVSVMVWDSEAALAKMPQVGESQSPNVFFVAEQIDFKDGFKTDAENLQDTFVGEATGWIDLPGGVVDFQVEADDGGSLTIAGQEVCHTEDTEGFTARGTVDLPAGKHPFVFRFYEDGGGFHARLKWRRSSSDEYMLVPPSAFSTSGGLTFVVSPGPKRMILGAPRTDAGDLRPLEGVHPSFALENFRGPAFEPMVGGLCFMPDGRLAVATWDPTGSVYLVDNLNGPGSVKISRFASGLGEPLGIQWVDGALVVTQKQEVTRLTDENGDGVADGYEAVAEGWAASWNYHEFSFNLVPWRGAWFIATSVPLKSGDTNYTPGSAGAYAVPNGPGSIFRIDPKTGAIEKWADGMRTPNGMAALVDGELFVSDNQGDWLPSSVIYHVKKGGAYLHQLTADGDRPTEKPVAWLPQNEIGNSPSEPILIPEGPYAGQALVGDVTHGGLKRLHIYRVGEDYQGTVFRHTQGLEAGINRLVWGPDGSLYTGGVGSNGNWNHLGRTFGLQRLRPTGVVPTEILRAEARANGVLLEMTRSIDFSRFEIVAEQWRYEPTVRYGGPKIDQEKLTVDMAASTFSGGQRALLVIPGLKTDRVLHLRLKPKTEADRGILWSTEAWLTVNALGPAVAPAGARGLSEMSAQRPRALPASQAWEPTWKALNGQGMWPQRDGMLTVDRAVGDIVTTRAFEDCTIELEWKAPRSWAENPQMRGNSGVKIMGRYEVQVLASRRGPEPVRSDDAGSVYLHSAAAFNPGFGPGVWQKYRIEFTAPRWQGREKTQNARMRLFWNDQLVFSGPVPDKTGASSAEAPGPAPLLLQAHATESEGEVQFRNVRIWAPGLNP
jgi:hypothetical protein